MSAKRPETDWTPEESRFVDGELGGEALERLERELAGDSERRDHLEVWREAMDVWRDDTSRRASRIPPEVLTDRILREASESPPPAETAGAARRYVAAALVLIGLGLVGSIWLGAHPESARAGGVPAALRAVEHDRLDIEGDRAWQSLGFATFRPAAEER